MSGLFVDTSVRQDTAVTPSSANYSKGIWLESFLDPPTETEVQAQGELHSGG